MCHSLEADVHADNSMYFLVRQAILKAKKSIKKSIADLSAGGCSSDVTSAAADTVCKCLEDMTTNINLLRTIIKRMNG